VTARPPPRPYSDLQVLAESADEIDLIEAKNLDRAIELLG